jgi:hypothetical protein
MDPLSLMEMYSPSGRRSTVPDSSPKRRVSKRKSEGKGKESKGQTDLAPSLTSSSDRRGVDERSEGEHIGGDEVVEESGIGLAEGGKIDVLPKRGRLRRKVAMSSNGLLFNGLDDTTLIWKGKEREGRRGRRGEKRISRARERKRDSDRCWVGR